MLKVIGTVSSRALRVLWTLEELDLEYEHVAAPPRSSEVVEFNPAGKVPVLVEDGVPLTDSTAIVQYLADKHGKLTHKAGTLDRARQDGLTQFVLDEFDAALWMAARHSFILPEEIRHSAIKDSLKWEFERSQKTLVTRIAENGPFVMGDKMTVPDILLAHCGTWAIKAQFPITEPVFAEYIDRMQSRTAYRRAAER